MSSEVSIEELATACERGGVVVDVREPREYVDGHVPGALSIPMGQLPARRSELDPSRPVHVICASGNRSSAMTDYLRGAGFDAWSVAGGTTAWARSGRPLAMGREPSEARPGTGAQRPVVVTIETPTLGNRSYLAHDGRVAVVVDPQRDLDRVLAAAEEAGVRITHVVETHVHNDYVTGGLALARATGASYHLNAADEVRFERTPVHDGDLVEVSPTLRLRALATPGHTFTHLSYALEAVAPGGGVDTVAVFTGGSLLYGATGRPDLLGAEHTHALVHHQYASAQRLAAELPGHARVLPTHGFGSFCSAGSSGGATESTIGDERRSNPVLTADEERWVAETLAGLDEYPAYYAHMAPANSAGPDAPSLDAPAPADKEVLARRIAAGEWVVDLRTRSAFADGHVVGTVNIGLDGQFATYLGWLVPWGDPVTLLGETPEQVAEAQRELVRIGVDRPAGAATGSPHDWTDGELGHFPRAVFADLAEVRHHRPVTVLDVRRVREHSAGHLEGAVHIPLHELPGRLDEVPAGEVWVHCAGGYRAGVAASLLAADGRRVVAVDDAFDHVADAGLPLVTD